MNISHPSIQANIKINVYIHTHTREIYVCLEVVILFCCSSIYRIYEHQQQKHVAPKFLYLEKTESTLDLLNKEHFLQATKCYYSHNFNFPHGIATVFHTRQLACLSAFLHHVRC